MAYKLDELPKWKQKLLKSKSIPKSFAYMSRVEFEDVVINELISPHSGGILPLITEEYKKKISDTLKRKGIKPPPNTHTAKTIWWTDGKINKRSKTCPGDDFIEGRTLHYHPDFSSNRKWWTNGIEEKFSLVSPGIDYKLGRKPRG